MMQLRTLLFALTLLFLHVKVNAQYNFTKVDAWLQENTPQMGGRAVLMIYKDGKIIHTQTVNEMSMRQKMANRFIARRTGKSANTDDFTPQSKQAIASCSKWLSAALVMTFVDEGKLKLTDTVGKFLPVLSQNGKGSITISQCLSHLTGIQEPPLKENLADMKGFNNMDDAINYLAKLPMEGKPGTVFHYSNAGLQIAGAVVEKISGQSFETLFAQRIATPLDMKNTDFGKGKVPLPAGGANASTQDYMNFLAMILNKGTYNGKRILSEESIKQMQINRLTPDVKVAHSPTEAGNFGYGFGEWVMGGKNAKPGGPVTSPGLFGSFPWVDNEKGYTAFLMCYYLKNDGRHERYKELKALVDEAVK